VLHPNAFIHIAEKETRLVVSTCCWCGRRAASSNTEVLRIAERSHTCTNEDASGGKGQIAE
jgi:hypothetical protein